ncbi:MAG: autotransporter domain-containing protein [Gammaproteobacteria bacterium]|jgi:uncharacterized protein with beta-barrel porin domain|nr:autotransporter domain-containing protein [Gammaproteobacteria bacterium]
MKKTFRLTHAVLTSSLFVVPSIFADTQITANNTSSPAVAGPPYQTSVAGNIEILPAGIIQPAANVNAIEIDSEAASVIIDANNANLTSPPNAILTTGTGIGISILAAGKAANVIVNTGSNINSTGGTGDAISIAGDLAVINNSGKILSGKNGIELTAGGTNASITNSGAGSIIQGATTASILDAGTGLVLLNTNGGVIQATGLLTHGVLLNVDFNSVTNNAGSTISSDSGSAVIINGSTVGTITNSGTITSTGAGIGLNLTSGAYTGTITNTSTGIIQNTSAAGLSALNIKTSFGAINNAGIIQSTLGPTDTIDIGANVSGTLTNTGTIQSLNTSSTIVFSAASGLTGLVNSGTISANDAQVATINASAPGVTIPNGIINTGIIIDNGVPATAIDLSGVGNIIPLFQNGGTITGDVLLAGGGGNVLTMTGGTVNGDIFSTDNVASTLNFSGGTVSFGNVVFLGNIAGNILNLSGTASLDGIIGGNQADTYNVSGGSFSQLIGGAGDILNVNASFTSPGLIASVPTINVNNAGTTFTNSGIIANVSTALNINANTTMNANGNVTGTGALTIFPSGVLNINSGVTVTMGSAGNPVTNNGYLSISNNGILQTGANGNYVQNGAFAPLIQNMSLVAPFGFGQIDVGAGGVATFNAGSTINPQLGNGTFILDNFVFPVVQSGAPVVGFGNITVVQPSSAMLYFTKDNNPVTNVNLISHTNPLVLVAVPDIPLSVAASLDPLIPTTPAQIAALAASNPDFLIFLGQLQLLPDITAVSNALLQLAPSFNYALPGSSRIIINNAFDSVQARLEALNGLGPLTQDESYKKQRDYELYNGVNNGDSNVIDLTTGRFGAWFKVYGEIDDQLKRHQIEGYRADATGIALGGDWRISPYALVGVAESLTKVNTTDATSQQNKVNINSYMTTFYGWFQPMQLCSSEAAPALYIDTMLGFASHEYDTQRNISIGTFNAQANANFFGMQYGAQMDIGYAFISSDEWYVAPVARFKYTYLDISTYSETGADGLSLSVVNEPLDEVIAGIGIRLAAVKNFVQAIYVPEFSVMLLYDFAGSVQQSQSNFLIGGNPFYTNSIKPAQYIQLYGLGVNAYTSDNYTFSIKVNLEHRDHFYGYDGFMQLHYKWD